MIDAYASYSVHNTISKGRPCLKGVVEVEAEAGWFAFTVFGYSAEAVQNSAYMQADFLSESRGWKLQALRRA
jgi:hypothetical protein